MRCLNLLVALILLLSIRPMPSVLGQAYIDAAVGTYNYGAFPSRPAGTAVCFAWRSMADTASGMRFVLRGPRGWNDNAVLYVPVSRRPKGTYQDFFVRGSAPFAAGSYALSGNIDGAEVSVSFSSSGEEVIDPPAIQVNAERRDRISANWTVPRGAASFRVILVSQQDDSVVAGLNTRSTSHTFEGVVSEAGKYWVGVLALPIDLTTVPGGMPRTCNISYATADFLVR